MMPPLSSTLDVKRNSAGWLTDYAAVKPPLALAGINIFNIRMRLRVWYMSVTFLHLAKTGEETNLAADDEWGNTPYVSSKACILGPGSGYGVRERRDCLHAH